MKPVYHKIILFLVFTSLVFFFFLRLFYPRQQIFMIPDFGESDVLHLNLPLKGILSDSLKKGEWPLWTPYLANGFPLLAEGQIGTFYLPNLLLFRFLPTVTAYNLNLAIAFLLSGIGCILFFRSTGFSRLSSFYAAIVFTFSGFFTVHLNHFNLVQAVSLLPLIFWVSCRLRNRHKFADIILFAFLLSQQIFTGHFYIVFITLVGVLVFFAVNRYRTGYLFIGLVIAFLLSAIQLFPTIELQQKSGRQGGLPFETVTSYPYPPKHLLAFINPYVFGIPQDGTYPAFDDGWGVFWENTAYIGILPLLLAFSSLIYIKERWAKTGFVLLSLSLLLVLGKYSPLYFVFSIPPFNFFRVPSKFLLLVTFSLTMLSTYSLEKIIGKFSRYASYLLIGLIFFLVLTDEYRFSYNYPPTTPGNWWTDKPKTADIIGSGGGRVASIGAPKFWNSVFLKDGWKDMLPYVYFRNSLYPNYSALFAIPNADINTGGLVPKRTSLFTSINQQVEIDENEQTASVSAAIANILSLQGVNYLVSPYKIKNPQFQKVAEVDSDTYNLKLNNFTIYKNPKSLPRAYIAYRSKLIKTVEDYYREVSDEKFLEKGNILVEDNRLLMETNNSVAGQVRIVNSSSQNITLQTDSPFPGILVVTDSFYPGWKVYLDGKETEIFAVNLNQRGILLPSGTHKVQFIFKPASFTIGKFVSVISGLTVFGVLFLCRVLFPRKVSGNKKPWRCR